MIKKNDIILKNVRSQNGITVISLVVTIIVMIILASVTIYSSSNENNGMLNMVEKQREDVLETTAKQEVEVATEKIKLENASNNELTVSQFSEQLQGKLRNDDENAKVEVTGEGYKVTYKGYNFQYYYWYNTAPVINLAEVKERDTNFITIRARAVDEDLNMLTYKLYLKNSNGTYSTTPNAISSGVESGTYVDLQATDLETYTVYNYKVEVTDGISTVASEEGTTGTGCNGKEYTCSKASSSICSLATQTGTRTCGGYKGTGQSVATCSSCGGNCYVTLQYNCSNCGTGKSITIGCQNPYCGAGTGGSTDPGLHTVSVYTCTTHGYEGTSSTHTVYTNCQHGYSSSHKYCRHNKTSVHFPN